jgi:anti-anti-sigma factor
MNSNGPACTLTISREQEVLVFLVSGYFTEESGETLKNMVMDEVHAGNRLIVLDFKDCPVINSLGIAAVMQVSFEIMDEHNGKVALSQMNPIVRNAMTIAGLIPLLDVCLSVEDAIESVRED